MRTAFVLLLVFFLGLFGCSSLTLRPADFAWPVEQVVKVDAKGMANVMRYSFAMNVKPLLFEETGDSTNVARWSIRVLCDQRGFYFLTADGFKHVYVFKQADAELAIEERILIAEQGISGSALNQRAPHVELVREGAPAVKLSPDGIVEGGSK